MFYRHSPFHYPITHSWVPLLLTPPTFDNDTNNTNGDEHAIKESAMTSNDSSIIYRDRNVRIQQQDDNIVYSLDLPGIKASDAKIEIKNGVLSVQAERKAGNNYTKYAQQFLIKESDVDSQNVKADLAHGVLTITIPKKEEAKPLAIPVAAGYAPEKANNDKVVRFTVDLPGVKPSDVTMELKDETISLHATRKVFDKETIMDRYLSIDRTKIDPTSFEAYLADGVLTVTGTKRDEPEPKPILINNGPTVLKIEEKKK
jgi:HSP20 family molecular chaperone IbpA